MKTEFIQTVDNIETKTKITVYELLGLIKDGKAPKKIKHKNQYYGFGYDTYTDIHCLNNTPDVQSSHSLFARYRVDYILNDEVEILDEEDKKIEKLDVALLGQCDNWLRCPTNEATKLDIELNPYIIDNVRENTLYFQRKINEIIDAVNKLKENE